MAKRRRAPFTAMELKVLDSVLAHAIAAGTELEWLQLEEESARPKHQRALESAQSKIARMTVTMVEDS